MTTIAQLRAEFDQRSKGSMSLPIAGAITWAVVAALGLLLPFRQSVFALIFATGAIFPIAMLVARMRGEELLNNDNPFAKLMGLCVLMVNLLWAVHVPLLLKAPEFVPLSLGIALGLHWMVYSWIIQHPLGMIHAVVRTLGLVAVWFLVPSHPVTASAAVVVAAYALTIVQMAGRRHHGA